MKKKIVNGILLVAMLFATTSAFVSCKDTDSDVKAELDAKYAALEKKFNDLQTTVGKIKSCDCDSYTKAQIDQKLKDLDDAIKAVKSQIPSVDGFLKAEDLAKLPELQTILSAYYTKEAAEALFAKKSDVPEAVDLTKYFTKSEIEALLAEYVKTADLDNVDLTNYLTAAQINELLADYAKKGEVGISEAKVKELIAAEIAKIEIPTPNEWTEDDIIELIKDYIDGLDNELQSVYTTEVTSLVVDKVENPLYNLYTPFGVNTNVLIAFFGEKAERNIFFPKGAEEPIVWKGDYIIEREAGNAGMLYVTVNPSTVDFTDKTLKLVSTTGNESPVELTPLKKSNKELKYLSRGDDEDINAFYETYATIPENKIAKAYFTWQPTNMADFREQIDDLLKARRKEDIADMLQTLTNVIAGNDMPAYRLQAAWEGGYTYSQANIAAIAIQPLNYAFDLKDEGEFVDEPINELEDVETYIVNRGTKTQSTRNKIWRWLNKFNAETNRWLNNLNWALQPTMFIECDNEISRPGILLNYTSYPAGEITLIPSSWTAEMFAPAFKKYVTVTTEDGKLVQGEYLNRVLPGTVYEIPLTIESGKKYDIQYSAVDYAGNIRTLNYFIKGGK
jgi:hypothetical protein